MGFDNDDLQPQDEPYTLRADWGECMVVVPPTPALPDDFLSARRRADDGVRSAINWDDPAVKMEYNRNPLCFKNVVLSKFHGKAVPIVFDEIHKHKNWKNILKGFFDTTRDKMQLLVTGSARLGAYRKSGDSLIGRYFSFQMFPLSLPEATGDFSLLLNDDGLLSKGEALIRFIESAQNEKAEDGLKRLLTFGGFPEPHLKGSQRFLRRWHQEYKTLLTKEDVRDLSRVSDLRGLEQLIEILPSKVGSPLSINSVREDLGYHHRETKHRLL